MSLDELLKGRRLVWRRPTAERIADVLAVAEGIDFSADGRFMLAYGAALASADAMVRAAEYRSRGQGHHHTLFVAFENLVPEKKDLAGYFEQCRAKRNAAVYDKPGQASQTEADELLALAKEFRAFAER